MRRLAAWCLPWADWLADALVALVGVLVVASCLGIGFMFSGNWPTGGDSASHLLYAKGYADEFLFSGRILPWMPEVFAGFPFLSYYFPLPFIVIACLSQLIGFAQAFKWGAFLAAMLLPGAVFAASRRWLGFSWPAALFGALGALAFLLHEQNSIWGGNLLSTLAGEFAYSYGLLFALLAMLAWVRALYLGRGWLLPALLEAACGFSHGFPLLLLGFSTAFLLLDGVVGGGRRETLARLTKLAGLLLRGHLLAFMLLGGWLWPMLEMHGLTIANDAAFPVSGWRDLLPATLWPILVAGLAGLVLLALPSVRASWNAMQRKAAFYLVNAAGLSAVAFIAGDRLGLADIRFFPPIWLLGAIVCGWLFGQALLALTTNGGITALHGRQQRGLLALAASLAMLGWFSDQVRIVPDWGLWNHSGLQAKPQWSNLNRLFPAMQGDLWSPRLLFEHDPDNKDLGSTRTLEALPMFLGGRPVLEGLYMESALLGPAVYLAQSEVSARPSSPLVRFPSASLDAGFAARHMNFLHADSVLLRSDQAKTAVAASGLFDKVAEAPPFALYRLKRFDSRLAEVVRLPVRLLPKRDWMQEGFTWFRLRSRFDAYLPVYADGPVAFAAGSGSGLVRAIRLDRHRLEFETEAVGRPHLIKMAWHPRWQLQSQGSLHIAGPGFMLVVPQEKTIRLEFGHTLIGRLGMLASAASGLLALWLCLRRRNRQPEVIPEVLPSSWRRLSPMFAGWILLLLAGAFFAWTSPERAYRQAWEHRHAKRFEEATERFRQAYDLRRPPAKKEEALFWLAKSLENAGHPAEAAERYRELTENYHGYWLPESLYAIIQFERQRGHPQAAEANIWRLREEYPNNPWTLKIDRQP